MGSSATQKLISTFFFLMGMSGSLQIANEMQKKQTERQTALVH